MAKGGGQNPVIGYLYALTVQMGLCYGPIDKLLAIKAGGKLAAADADGLPSAEFWLYKPMLFGGMHKEGGINAYVHVALGAADQQPDPLLASIETAPRIAYRGVSCVNVDGAFSAINPYIKPWAFQVECFTAGWTTDVWEPDLVRCGMGMNPAHIIYQCYTDTSWGRGLAAADAFDLDKMSAAAQTLHDEDFGLCLKWSAPTKLDDFIAMICDHCGGMMVQDPTTGLHYLKLIRGGYDIDDLPVLDASNIVKIKSFSRPQLTGSVNQVTVTYHDATTNKDAAISYQNLANIQAQGEVVDQAQQYPGAYNAEWGARLAARDTKLLSSLLAKGKFQVKRDDAMVPGAVYCFKSPARGIAAMALRILGVDRGTPTARIMTVSVAEDVFGLPQDVYVTPAPPGWVPPDEGPYPCTAQYVFEAPYVLIARRLTALELENLDADAGYIATLGVRPPGVAMNYEIREHVGTEENFGPFGWPGDFCASGVLSAAMSETTTAIVLDDAVDMERIVFGTAAYIDDEIVRIDGVNLDTGALTIARGCADTVPAKHAALARLFAGGGGGVDFTGTEFATGDEAAIKLLPRNGSELLALADAPLSNVTFHARAARPYPPGNLKVNGVVYPPSRTSAAGDFVLAWSHRDRIVENDRLVDTTESEDIGPEPGTTYTVRAYLDDALYHTQAGIADTTHTVPRPNGAGTVKIEIETVREDVAEIGAGFVDFQGNPLIGGRPITNTRAVVLDELWHPITDKTFTFSFLGDRPAWLYMDSQTGAWSGNVPIAAALLNPLMRVTVMAVDNEGLSYLGTIWLYENGYPAFEYEIEIGAHEGSYLDTDTPQWSYSVADDVPAPIAYQRISGAFPPGWQWNDGTLTAVAGAAAGSYSWRIGASDALDETASVADSVMIVAAATIQITGAAPAQIPKGVATSWEYHLVGATADSWEISAGDQPTGMQPVTVSDTVFKISGTPNFAGPFAWTVKAMVAGSPYTLDDSTTVYVPSGGGGGGGGGSGPGGGGGIHEPN